MNKEEFASYLETLKNNYIFGYAALALFADSRALDILRVSEVRFGDFILPFGQLADALSNDTTRPIYMKEFAKMNLRALVKEAFELVKVYAAQTNQMAAVRAAPWFQFARLIRNALSHDFHLQLSRADLQLLPLTWRNRTIEASMNGQPVPLAFFGYAEAWQLFNDLASWSLANLQ